MKIPHLTLKRQWFDMIASGEKKEEYRELKPYWETRFQKVNGMRMFEDSCKEFDAVRFTNGYGKGNGTFLIECKGIKIGEGKPEWGARTKCYIIKLGKIITP